MNEVENLIKIRNHYALPLFIAVQDKNKWPCLSQIFPCLFSQEKYRTDNIKEKDLKTYHQLKAIASLDYNQDNTAHEESLKFLYLKTINSDLCKDLTSAQWEDIGFNVSI